MTKSIYFIQTLDLYTLLWFIVKGKKPIKVFYVTRKISCRILRLFKQHILFEKTDLYLSSSNALNNEARLINYIEKLFKISDFYEDAYSVLKTLELNTDKLMTSLKKYVLYWIKEDIKLITLAKEKVINNENKYVCVQEYKLLKDVVEKDINIIRFSSPGYLLKEMVIYPLISIKYFIRIFLTFRNHTSIDTNKIKFVFEQMYRGQEKNPEFKAFYKYFRYREDILYICTDHNSKIYKDVKADKKYVLCKKDIDFQTRNKMEWIQLWYSFFIKLYFSVNLRSNKVKRSIGDVFRSALYYETIFKEFNPTFYLKIRSDLDESHPVTTAVADKNNVIHIGYQHGSYIGQAEFAYIDFHHYGLLGKNFREELYPNTWPKNIKYNVLGPITGEIIDNEVQPVSSRNRYIISIFCTSDNDDNYIWRPIYKKLLITLCQSLKDLSISKFHLIFKEKGYTIFFEEIIFKLCNKYDFSYELAYHLHPSEVPFNYSKEIISRLEKQGQNFHLESSKIITNKSAEEILSITDIFILISPYGMSTTLWEALGKMKKVIVMLPEGQKHPFEKYIPGLIVSNNNDLLSAIKYLKSISQKEYEGYIQPLIDNWCKISNGSLINDFIKSIEYEYI